MVNYRCSAACRHCLYACSPTREAGYVDAEKAAEICRLLKAGRCGSVHIGGGEPFLDFEGLLVMVRALSGAGIRLDYIETNAFWVKSGEEKAAGRRIDALMEAGVDALCISVDPFHAEYVPYGRPLLLARLCEKRGMGYFLWREEFLPLLSRIEGETIHSRAEMEERLSPGYIRKAADAYGITLGGRAVNIEEEYAGQKARNAEELLDDDPCRGLLSTGHFHVDFHGNFIPPGCTGLRLPLAELVAGIAPGKYPVFEALYERGIRGLWELAGDAGFTANTAFSKCNLCFHLRRFLSGIRAGGRPAFAELDADHYEESLKYYGARDKE
jgi:hypothetical protein